MSRDTDWPFRIHMVSKLASVRIPGNAIVHADHHPLAPGRVFVVKLVDGPGAVFDEAIYGAIGAFRRAIT
jgi:hypothetical protein